MNYWLLKSEPDCFSIEALSKAPKKTAPWDGVRNYQARNMLRDEIRKNDLAFFYHSSCDIPGIVGVVRIVKEGYPDFTAEDPNSDHHDPKHTQTNPRWYMVDVQLEQTFKSIVSLAELKQNPLLENMRLLQRGNRLSVMPVTSNHWQLILSMAG